MYRRPRIVYWTSNRLSTGGGPLSLFERLFGGLLGRQDTEPLGLPGPVPDWRGDSVMNQLTGLGSPGDKGAAGRPNLWTRALSHEELGALYANNGMARRIVDLLVTRATRRGWTCPDIGPDEEQRLRSWDRITETMSMARLHGGAVLLMVTEDDVPSEFQSRPWGWLEQPLDLERVGRLHALQVFDAMEASPVRWETDVTQPGFRLPSMWHLAAEGFSARVHASRVVHFRGNRRPPSEIRAARRGANRMPDDSVLQVVWDEIHRLTATMQGGAVLAQEIRESVLKLKNLSSKQVGDDSGGLLARVNQLAKLKSILHMFIIGEGDEYENRSNPPTGFKELSGEAKSMLAAVSDYPEMVLFGDSPSGLNTDGESSWQGFRQQVSDYQERNRYLLDQLYTVVYAAQDGPTNGQIPDEWAVEFLPLDEPSAKETAELRKLVADIDHIYITDGVYGPEAVAEGRFGEDGWQLDLPEVEVPDADEEAAIAAAQKLMEGMPQQPPPAPGIGEA